MLLYLKLRVEFLSWDNVNVTNHVLHLVSIENHTYMYYTMTKCRLYKVKFTHIGFKHTHLLVTVFGSSTKLSPASVNLVNYEKARKTLLID